MTFLRTVASIHRRFLSLCFDIAGLVMFSLMFLITADVFGRYVFIKPIPGTYEIVQMLLVFKVFLSYAYLEHQDKNVKVRLIDKFIGPRQSHFLNAFSCLIGAFIFGVIFWQGWEQAMIAVTEHQRLLGLLRIPIAPVKFTLVLGSFLLALQFFIGFVASIYHSLQRSLE